MFDYNAEVSELYVGTESDIRCVDLHTGKIKRVLANIVTSDVEINVMKLNFDKKAFIIGNSQGEIKIFSITDGRFKHELLPHGNDISGIDYDDRNALYISAGWDSSIMVQETKSEKPVKIQK